MAYNALLKAGLPFDLVSSDDIKKGQLENYTMLFVPGGWSSNKLKALGDEGIEAVRRFVRDGGNYLGFCGGAGLATREGISLLDIRRKPTKERVPSFSGGIALSTRQHAIWGGIRKPVFHAWWPPQFDICDEDVRVLASYKKALPDAFTSDLCIGDVGPLSDWAELEKTYRINLDPERLSGEPAVVSGKCGKGTVVLSLIHFDTPDDPDAKTVLINLWNVLSGGKTAKTKQAYCRTAKSEGAALDIRTKTLLDDLDNAVDDLITFGTRNFLWFWRSPLLLQWRRGIRGLEYNTLYSMVRSVTDECRRENLPEDVGKKLQKIKKRLVPFIERSKQLLIFERFAMQQGHITFEQSHDSKIQSIRSELFSSSKSYGGLFKEILDEIDSLLFELLHTNY
ncbi:MAG: hypothetical protein HZB33_04495 [Nitrospirae bacterium]|nr:hypothetical protein [Nitrospirota bacterium]